MTRCFSFLSTKTAGLGFMMLLPRTGASCYRERLPQPRSPPYRKPRPRVVPSTGSPPPQLFLSMKAPPVGRTALLTEWVIPELVGHTIVTVLMLVSLHWFIFLLNLPVATWNIYRFIMVPSGNMGVFDPTEIHNRGQLKSHMKEAMIKLGFYLLCFFMYLYSMILALIND
uniref:Protein cornichon homolog 4 n=1 Tax=Mus spicilegus TaxID=10103 RepID=A0A8C6GN40_MUSSI